LRIGRWRCRRRCERWSIAAGVPAPRCPSIRGTRSSGRVNRERGRTPHTPVRALPPRTRLGLLGEFVPLGVPPESFERIEIAALAAEDVDDEVEIIEQDPLGLLDALGQMRPLAEFGPERLFDEIRDRIDLPRV